MVYVFLLLFACILIAGRAEVADEQKENELEHQRYLDKLRRQQ